MPLWIADVHPPIVKILPRDRGRTVAMPNMWSVKDCITTSLPAAPRRSGSASTRPLKNEPTISG
eukprot:5576465-Prymnesium_polylepis.1